MRINPDAGAITIGRDVLDFANCLHQVRNVKLPKNRLQAMIVRYQAFIQMCRIDGRA